MLTGTVGGRAELKHVQGLLATSGEDLHARLLKQTREAMKPTKADVVAATKRLPSGYAPLMAKAVRVATRVTSAGSTIKGTARVSAMGKGEKRDVAAINLGRLRHPLFGRRVDWVSRRGKLVKAWHDTAVRPRFVSDPIDDLADRIGDGARKAADGTADRIVRG